MTFNQTAPLVAAILVLIAGVAYALNSKTTLKGKWVYPAALSALFFGFTLYAAVQEGVTGFWTEHIIRNLWGNQIWFDLLLAVCIGWFFIVPQAKAIGIRPLPWFFVILALGSVGFLAFLAYFLWRQEQQSSV